MSARKYDIGFVGRRKAKPLKDQQQEVMDRLLPDLLLDLSLTAPADLTSLFSNVKNVHLEIGFGSGEHLVHRAKASPEIGYIGVEPFINGMGRALQEIDEAKLTNIRLFDQDAKQILDWLPPSSISQLALLYPDPWHKFKHWKRRFVSMENLDRFARVLKTDSLFLFASDIEHYVAWTLKHCEEHPNFQWQANKCVDWIDPETGPHANWPGTRYEAKALREGRTPSYLSFLFSSSSDAI